MDWLEGYRHTPSKCKLIKNAIQLWVLQYILKEKSPVNDNLFRGTVAQEILYYRLGGMDQHNAEVKGRTLWDKLGGKEEKEREFAVQCSTQFFTAMEELQLRRLPHKTEEQLFGDSRANGLQKSITGITDINFPTIGHVIDLKSTKRVPSSLETANDDDIDQQGVYWHLKGRTGRFSLLYASDKKYAFFEIPKERLEEGWQRMFYNMDFIERTAKEIHSTADWFKRWPYPDLSSKNFYFNDEKIKQTIKDHYGGLI